MVGSALVLLSVLVVAPHAEAPEPVPTLPALIDLGDFTVRVDGNARTSPWSNRRCVYFEWSYKDGPTRWRGFQSEEPFTVKTPKGSLQLARAQVRTHLGSSYTRTFTRKDAAKAPEPVAQRIKEDGRPLTVEEFCLSPGVDYHARVRVETYSLPPTDEGGAPGHGTNAVLVITDKAFKDGRPQRDVTPGFEGWTY